MISVVIPLFNHVRSLPAALDSVLAQTRPAHEIIIVDDGSTDGGASACKQPLPNNVRIVHQPNRGVSAARNHGVRLASSPLVAFLDADDSWDPHHLADVCDLDERFPEAVAFGTRYRRVDFRGRASPIEMPHDVPFLVRDYYTYRIRHRAGLTSSSSAVRRDLFLRTGGFPEGISAGEDLVAWARIAADGPIALHPRDSAVYNVRDVAAGDQRRPADPDRVAELFEQLAAHAPSTLAVYRGAWHRIRAAAYCELGETRACLRELQLATSHTPVTRRDLALVAALAIPSQLRRPLFRQYRVARFRRTGP